MAAPPALPGAPPQRRADFSPAVEKRNVPASWGTWGSPPATETAQPNLLYTVGATSIEIEFSKRVWIVGMEVEPNPFDKHDFQLEFFDGAQSLGSITRNVDGDAWARLLAGRVRGVTSVVVSSDVDFGIARLRVAG